MPLLGTNNLDEYISRYQVDGIVWFADRLLLNLDNPILRNDRCKEIASLLADIPADQKVVRDDYLKRICKNHDLKTQTLEKMIADVITQRSKAEVRQVRKNKVKTLKSDPKTFPFFKEMITQDKNGTRSLQRIKIDKLKFVELLSSFGFSRYSLSQDDTNEDFTFVRIVGNVITAVTRAEIIDYLEHFVKEEYDFEAAKCEFVDPDELITTLYDNMRTIFSKDLFARVRLDSPIIISRDKSTITYLYFKNGFVQITPDGYTLCDYKDLDGSVWSKQLKDRTFVKLDNPLEVHPDYDPDSDKPQQRFKCVFADFIYKLSGDKLTQKEIEEGAQPQRFESLMCVIGYLIHDYYAYNLKAVYFTDSAITDESEGRTGKTLMMKMVGEVRAFCEIHGKLFDPHNEKRYETVTPDTQLVHINDVSNKGRNKFEIEPMFNDITEGLHVRAMYMSPFRTYVKIAISGNKSLMVSGGSAQARIFEYEVSNFFSVNRRPDQFYGHWFGRDWDHDQWNMFDNFICLCAQMFHVYGLKEPPVINLKERKLRDHTHPDFLEFMVGITDDLKKTGRPWEGYTFDYESVFDGKALSYDIHEFVFDRKRLYERFIYEYTDHKSWLKANRFNTWLRMYGELRLGVTPTEWKSNSRLWVQFKQQ